MLRHGSVLFEYIQATLSWDLVRNGPDLRGLRLEKGPNPWTTTKSAPCGGVSVVSLQNRVIGSDCVGPCVLGCLCGCFQSAWGLLAPDHAPYSRPASASK